MVSDLIRWIRLFCAPLRMAQPPFPPNHTRRDRPLSRAPRACSGGQQQPHQDRTPTRPERLGSEVLAGLYKAVPESPREKGINTSLYPARRAIESLHSRGPLFARISSVA